jgi:hypothetical protein
LAEAEPNDCFDRIDFIYYSSGDARPVESFTLDPQSSDHRAVLTVFDIDEPEKPEVPGAPLPASSSSNVRRHPLFTWVSPEHTAPERIYLGTSPEGVADVEVTDGRWVSSLLAENTTYYWRVESETAGGAAVSETFQFTTLSGGGLEPDARSVNADAPIEVAFDGADSVTDWIGLYPASGAYGSSSPAPEWQYLSGTQTQPGAPIASGTLDFKAPSTPGKYVLRFFDSDGYVVEDEVHILVH